MDATGGTSANGGNGGNGGVPATGGNGGTGGTSANGGVAGSSTSGGSAGSAGASTSGASNGGSSAGAGTGGMGGATSGGMGGATSGGMGGATSGGMGGATSGGMGGATSGGMGGASGSAGTLGQGGFAGVASLGDCQTATFNAHDYALCNVNVPWTTARDNCWSIGMELVRVEDAAEDQWIHDNAYDTAPRQGVWIGANDRGVEGEWRWLDGSLFWLGNASGAAQNGLHEGWLPTQPSGNPAARDCAAIDQGATVGWYDLDCATPQPFICRTP
jgi:hypothetical protein